MMVRRRCLLRFSEALRVVEDDFLRVSFAVRDRDGAGLAHASPKILLARRVELFVSRSSAESSRVVARAAASSSSESGTVEPAREVDGSERVSLDDGSVLHSALWSGDAVAVGSGPRPLPSRCLPVCGGFEAGSADGNSAELGLNTEADDKALKPAFDAALPFVLLLLMLLLLRPGSTDTSAGSSHRCDCDLSGERGPLYAQGRRASMLSSSSIVDERLLLLLLLLMPLPYRLILLRCQVWKSERRRSPCAHRYGRGTIAEDDKLEE